jgi:hypothetical protein
MLDKLRVLLDDILGEETPKEDDNEEAKIRWIIDEFDFRNNNDELVPGIDILVTKSSRIKRKRSRSLKTPMSQSSSSSTYSDSYYSDESSDVA